MAKNNLFKEVGKKTKLVGNMSKDFIKFMHLRFPNEKSFAYVEEWALRFKNHQEWMAADGISRVALRKVNKKYKKYTL